MPGLLHLALVGHPPVVALVLLLGCPHGVDEKPTGGVTTTPMDTGVTDTASTDSDTTVHDSDSAGDTAVVPVVPEMDAVRLLARISLDIRGVRPDDAEIAAVQADPAAVDGFVDGWLADPRWTERLIDLYGERFFTLTEAYTLTASDYGLDDDVGFTRSVGEEPLRLLAQIAVEDAPYTDLVTVDWTMADERLAPAWPLDYPDGATGWQKVHYTDGRPSAGVLSTNAMWWRYGSTESNANRKRANAVSRVLLCNDYLSRPIEFERTVDLLDSDAVLDALGSDPACVGCHSTLDPLASYFFGFYYYDDLSVDELSVYHPEREALWSALTDIAPSYYGVPGYNLADLGEQIAADPRYVSCAVETAFELLLRREATVDDVDTLTAHREAFLSGGLTLRALYRSLFRDPLYRAAPSDDVGAVATKLAPPALISSMIDELTGFRWTDDGAEMLDTDAVGLRTLAGGSDGFTVLSTATSPSATALIVQQRLAELAGRYAADTERRVAPESRRLFREIDFTETPDTNQAAMEAQVQALYLRVHGRVVAVDAAEVTTALALWSTLYDLDPVISNAWAGVLTLLLRDPDLVLY